MDHGATNIAPQLSNTTDPNSSLKLGSRIRTAFLGLAITDALGAPLEFQPRRPTPSSYTVNMTSNFTFNLPPGHFTDDTSMALCLAHSLVSANSAHDPADQAARYVRWFKEGYMSSAPTRGAFDVGMQTRKALRHWGREPSASTTLPLIQAEFADNRCCGNGSLMRVLPCALVAGSEAQAVELARRSSEVTHPHPRCVDACAVYAGLVFNALRGASKDQLVRYITGAVSGDGQVETELAVRLRPYDNVEAFERKPRGEISSSGYVLNSLEAALWAFFGTSSFEEGAIEVVNLGDDADTVGAIYGGLAGAFYGETDEAIPSRWLKEMKELELIEQVLQGISQLHSME